MVHNFRRFGPVLIVNKRVPKVANLIRVEEVPLHFVVNKFNHDLFINCKLKANQKIVIVQDKEVKLAKSLMKQAIKEVTNLVKTSTTNKAPASDRGLSENGGDFDFSVKS